MALSEGHEAATVVIRADTKSEFAGKTLRIVKIERGYGGKRTFLCEMPGYPHPGYFGEKEVEVVQP